MFRTLKFSAAWCNPCKQIAPTIDALAVIYAHKTSVVTINVDESPEVANEYGVRGVPSLVVLDETGNEVARCTGGQAANPSAVRNFFENVFA